MKTKKLIIVGTSNNAKLAKFYFDYDSEYKVVGFAIDSEYIEKNEFCGLQIFSLQQIQISHPPSEYDLFVAIGYKRMNKIRQEKYSELKKIGYKFPNYISSKCSFLTQEKIGDNNFILEDNTIQPFVKIGSNNVFWSGNHIGHDVEIGDHNFITSHVVISGFTKVGNNCFFGVNSTFRDSISIADFNLIAAGAIIMKDTNEGDVYLPNRSILSDKKSFDIEIS